MFTTPNGAPLHPDYLTRRFAHLVTLSGLPPVRLHDLRHGAASLAHAAGADLKTVQEQLGHSSIVLTADTYTSVLHELHIKTAEATARLVLAAAARAPGQHHRKPGPQPARTGPPQPARQQPTGPAKAKRRKRSGKVDRSRQGAHTRPTDAPQRSKPHSPLSTISAESLPHRRSWQLDGFVPCLIGPGVRVERPPTPIGLCCVRFGRFLWLASGSASR